MGGENVINMNRKKKKSSHGGNFTKGKLIFILFIVLIGVLLSNLFVVKEGEYKIIRQFGEVVRIDSTPGLSYKIPFIQTVTTLPKYQMIYDVTEAEINTRDKKRMIIDNFAVWRINDPKKMISNARSLENAEAKMQEFIYSTVRTHLGQLNYDEIINDEISNRSNINVKITEKVNELLAQDNYGITVTDIRIKRTDLPAENEQSVFKRMISERDSKAQEYLSMGDAEKQRIVAETDRMVKEVISKAKANAAVIRSQGEAEAAQIYNEAFSKDPDFYSIYRTLESYKQTINEETFIIIPANSQYASILSGNIN